jgi:hypothetical protein
VNDNVQFSAFTKRELASLQRPFKLWEMKPLKNLAKWLMTFRSSPKAKLSQLDILAQKQIRPSGESLMVHQSLAVVKRDGYLMVSLISVYQVEAQPEHFGKAWNSDQRSSNNFQLGQGERQGAAQMATSSFQPFAKFSLN